MRWSYLIPRLIIIVLAWAFFAFLFDPLIRMGMVSAGQMAAEAKVDINNVQTALYPPALQIDNVQVANRKKPGTNLLQFDRFKFHLQGDALLRKRFVIEEGTITGLRFGTDRTDSGLLDSVPVNKENDSNNSGFGTLATKAKELGADWLEDVLARVKLQTSLKQFESVALADLKKKEWEARFEEYQRRVKRLEQKIKQIEKQTKKPKGNFLQQMEHYRAASQEVQQVLAESKRIRDEFPQLPKIAQRDLDELDAAQKRDQQKVKEKLNVFKMDGQELTDILLGPELANRLQTSSAWLQWSKQKYAGMEKTKPERSRGVNIFFPIKNEMPQLLIKKLHLAGEIELSNELLPFRGIVQGISSDSILYGKPTTIDIDAQGKSQFRLHSEIDYRTMLPVHRVQLAYTIPSMQETQLGNADKFGLIVSAGRTEWAVNITLTGEQLSGTIHLLQSPVAVVPQMKGEMKQSISDILEGSISGIEQIEATVHLSGTIQQPKWKLKSNLGDQIASGISKAMTAKLEQQKQKLALKLDAEYQKKTDELRNMMQTEFAEITSQLNLNDQFAQKQIDQLTKGNPNLRQAGRKLNFNRLFR